MAGKVFAVFTVVAHAWAVIEADNGRVYLALSSAASDDVWQRLRRMQRVTFNVTFADGGREIVSKLQPLYAESVRQNCA